MAEMPRTAEVVIIGGGVHGASLAYHLARRKIGRVALVERKWLASGPTGRSTALVRRFYGHDFFTRTANAAADVFQRWDERIGGDPGYRQVGYLVLTAAEEAEHLARNARRAQAVGARVALLTPAEVAALVPGLWIDDVALASWEAESGYADPVATTNALATRAREEGAAIVLDTRVEAIRVEGGRVVGVTTSAGPIDAPVVVNCAGLWAPRLLAPLGIKVEIRPTRHQMCVFERPPGMASHPAIGDRPQHTYMRPETGDLTLFGLGSHAHDEVVDPGDHDEGADPEQVLKNAEFLARRIPRWGRACAPRLCRCHDLRRTASRSSARFPVPGLFTTSAERHGFKHCRSSVTSRHSSCRAAPATTISALPVAALHEGDLIPQTSPAAPPPELATPGAQP
jgi:glycine/D-amino acid oxidase-like deaminating enzyme